MTLSWDVHAQTAACGLGGLGLVFLVRALRAKKDKTKPIGMSLLDAIVTALGCSAIVSGLIFLAYPFLDPKPDLKDQTDFVFVAGLALVYVAFSAFKEGID